MTADIVVIGAGTIGLPMSVMMARASHLRVVCLESGMHDQDIDRHPLNEVVHTRSEYRGAHEGRYRCYGGTSTRWGGALIPFQDADLDHGEWPLQPEDVEPFVARVESLFDLEPGPYEDAAFPFELGKTFVNRLAKWPIFKKRNVVSLVGREAAMATNLTVALDATVIQIKASPAGKGVEITAVSSRGKKVNVSAARLMVAAGAVETTRLALLIDQQNDRSVSATSPGLGRYFCDHIGSTVGTVTPRDTTALNKLIGWRFGRGGSMRNIRFELAPDSPQRKSLLPFCVLLHPSIPAVSGFVAVRELYRFFQRRRLPPAKVVSDLAFHLPWLARAAWWRYFNHRLLFADPGAPISVGIFQEQSLDSENRITLSGEKFDQFGVPLAEICWRPTDGDARNVVRAAELFAETWECTDFRRLGDMKRFPADQVTSIAGESGGIFHPTGSTRMGRDPSIGVVDRDLRMFAFPQIQLVATSVLPTGGGANPTMMALMLAVRCVDEVVSGT